MGCKGVGGVLSIYAASLFYDACPKGRVGFGTGPLYGIDNAFGGAGGQSLSSHSPIGL